jgi:hypothetical protein
MERADHRLLPACVADGPGRGRVTAYVAFDPFGLENRKHSFTPGLTIAEIVARTCPVHVMTATPCVFLGDALVYPQYWGVMRPKPGTVLAIRVLPEGGGGFLRSILTIAVFAASAYFAPGLAASLSGSFLPGGATALQIGIAKAAISGVGMLAVNAVAKPAPPRMNSLSSVTGKKESPTMFIQGARNQMAPYGKLRIVLGTHRLVPYQAAKPYTETAGDKQYVRQLFDWGLGDIELSDLRVGETDLASLTGVETEHVLDGASSEPIALFSNSADQEDFNIALTSAGSWQQRTTVPDADEINVDVTFGQGLFHIDKTGAMESVTIDFEVRYAPAGSGSWTTESISVKRATRVPSRSSYRFPVTRGQYDVAVRRVTADSSNLRTTDLASWTALRTFTYRAPIARDGVCLTALRLLGTDQLSGYVDQLSGLVKQKIPDYDADTGTWIKRTTSNPASLFRFVLQSEFNPTPVGDERVMVSVLEDWHGFCAENDLAYNAVIDFGTNVDDVLQEIAAAGRASVHRPDGRYGVVIDRPQDFSEALLVTPRNSFGYEYERVYPDVPHALIVEFLNEDKDYARDQRIVYADGYNKDGSDGLSPATRFERTELPGITDPDLVWKFGRWRLAEMQLRPDTHSFSQDIERLVINRGNPVEFGHDVPLAGLGSGRIKAITGPPMLDESGEEMLDESGNPLAGDGAAGAVLDEPVTMEAGKTYQLRWRRKNGARGVAAVDTVAGTQSEVSFTTPLAAADAPEPGDLFGFWETGREFLKLIPRTIEAGPNYSARLICVNAAPEIFDAATGEIPAFDSGQSIPEEMRRPRPPEPDGDPLSDESVQVTNLDGTTTSRMIIPLRNVNAAPVIPVVSIRHAGDTSFSPASVVSASADVVVLTDLDEGAAYDIEVRYRKIDTPLALAANLFSLPLVLSNVVFTGESTLPADVSGFGLSVRNGTAFFGWSRNTEIDLGGYEIRFTPDENADDSAWGASMPVDQDIGRGITRYETPAQLGTYLIKAFDRGGRRSAVAAYVNVATDALAGLTPLTTITEDPDWGGTHDGTVEDSGNLKLDSGESEGYYYFEDSYDRGSVDTLILNAVLSITGENSADLISTWPSIAERESFSGTAASQYNVTLQARTTSDDPGGSPAWSGWSALTVGDLTRRGIEFRLYLQSFESGVTPVVSAASVNIYELL